MRARFGRSKCVERAELVGVEVVTTRPPWHGGRLFHQPAHLVSEVQCGARSPGVRCHEQVPGPVSLVLGVIAFHPSGGPRWAAAPPQSIAWRSRRNTPPDAPGHTLLVQSLPRTGYEHILHPGHELPAHLGDAPLFLLPGLEFVFLSIQSQGECSYFQRSLLSRLYQVDTRCAPV